MVDVGVDEVNRTSLCLLGTPLLQVDDKPVRGLRSKSMALLAYLAVENRLMGRDTLATLFWPESGQSQSRGNLRTCLFDIQQAVDGRVVNTSREQIGLNSECLEVDVWRFRSVIRSCRTMRSTNEDPSSIIARSLRCSEVSELFGSGFMSGFTLPDCRDFDEWQYLQNESLRDDLIFILSRAVSECESCGRLPDAVAHLRRLSALDPLDEEFRGHLIGLLSMIGQKTSALREYEDLVDHLETELDSAPEYGITDLLDAGTNPYLAIRDVKDRPTIAAANAETLWKIGRPGGAMVGRDREMVWIKECLIEQRRRLLTLTGAPGTGKTFLATHVGYELRDGFPGGCAFVDLTGIDSPEAVIPAIVTTLKLGRTDLFAGKVDVRQNLQDWLTDRKILIVLDNFEHVVDAAKDIAELVGTVDGPSYLVTSREPLGIRNEAVLVISPLSYPAEGNISASEALEYDAVRLFRDRVKAVVPEFDIVDRNVEAVCRACTKLDGLPLAIELAAPLLKTFDIDELSGKLDNKLVLLTHGPRDLPSRQRNLKLTVDGSWRLLENDEKHLLSLLSLLPGEFSRNAILAVEAQLGDEWRVMTLLGNLVSKNLVEVRRFGQKKRFCLLSTIREYAGEKRDEYGVGNESRLLFAHFFRRLVARTAPMLHANGQKAAANMLEREHENILSSIRIFIDADDILLAASIAVDISWFWYRFGYGEIALRIFHELEPFYDNLPPELKARVFHAHGQHLFLPGRLEQAHHYYQKALEYCAVTENPEIESIILSDLDIVRRWMGTAVVDANGASPSSRSVALARRLNDPRLVVRALIWKYATTGGVSTDEGYETALMEALELAEQIGDEWAVAHSLNGLGDYYVVADRLDESQKAYRAALGGFASQRDRWMLGWTHLGLAEVSRKESDKKGHLVHLSLALEAFDSVGDGIHSYQALCLTALALRKTGREEDAALLLAAGSSPNKSLVDVRHRLFDERTINEIRAAVDEYRLNYPGIWSRGLKMNFRTAMSRIMDRKS